MGQHVHVRESRRVGWHWVYTADSDGDVTREPTCSEMLDWASQGTFHLEPPVGKTCPPRPSKSRDWEDAG